MDDGKLPVGTVTFLFTDIEGSTRLLQRLGHAGYQAVFEEHVRLIREAIAMGEGVEVSTEGDAFFAVFPSAPHAVVAAVEAQRSMAGHLWPESGSVRVRVGLHTGEGILGGDNYVGLDVHRAARIASAGHGGQILVSDTVETLVHRAVPPAVTLRDLGEHRLKDLDDPEHLYQVVVPDLLGEFPPPRSLDVMPHNLPVQLTEFIGRKGELATIQMLLSGTRLLTLIGPGGTGKTRLALRTASEALGGFSDGASFVSLAPIRDPRLLASSVAQALGVSESPGRAVLDALTEHLRDKQMLLVLDNFEQILPAASQLAELLAAAPGLKVLVTSRAPLRLAGEQVFPVPPLGVPKAEETDTDALLKGDAVSLFVQRARAVDPGFSLTPSNAAAVAEIVARLDGLPLAIELAAARLNLFPPEALLDRLMHGSGLLKSSNAGPPLRHRTLHDAIGWSYDLLELSEQALFERLAVFVGGFSLDAAEAVAGGAPVNDVLEGVSSLLDNSLLRRRMREQARFDMLETIREYALARLAEKGEGKEVWRRHALFFLELARAGRPELAGPASETWLLRLDGEQDNLRAALDWAYGAAEAELALELGGALWRFWHERGHLREARRRLEDLLALLRSLPESRQRDERELELQTALGVPSVILEGYGEPTTRETYLKARDLSQRLGRPPSGPVLRGLAMASLAEGKLPEAFDLGARLLAVAETEADPVLLVEAHYVMGASSLFMGKLARSRLHLEQALAHYEPAQHSVHIALYSQDPRVICLVRHGNLLWYLGHPDLAARDAGEALALAEKLGHPFSRAYALTFGSLLANDLGDVTLLRRNLAALAEEVEKEGLGGWFESIRIILEGWALTEGGGAQAGTDLIRKGLVALEAARAQVIFPYFMALLARGLREMGAVEHGLAAISGAQEIAARTNAHFWDAELYRLKGELLLARPGSEDEAKECFWKALEVARRQGARSLELRAATSLARHRPDEESHRQLKELYEWFTEGFDTPDLKEARALLEE
jgi:predicted ATPase/class 3 adenylate cyclase